MNCLKLELELFSSTTHAAFTHSLFKKKNSYLL
jgi:hypothetical protein